METVLRAQLTAQAAQGTAVPAVPAILMESLCQRRAEIALQHSDALHLPEIGGRTDAFVESQLSTSIASASSIQTDADALWQIVLNDPVKLLRAGVAYAYLHLQYLNNDVVRMCAVMDQVGAQAVGSADQHVDDQAQAVGRASRRRGYQSG